MNLLALLNHLTIEGYEVVTAKDGEQVLKLLDTSTYDMVIHKLVRGRQQFLHRAANVRKPN